LPPKFTTPGGARDDFGAPHPSALDPAGIDASAAVGVYSGGIHFFAPVVIGHLVDVDARIVYTSRHSMHLSTQVWTADPRTPEERMLTTQCLSVFVVPGVDGVARPVPQWTPELPEDVRLQEHVREIMSLREQIPPIAASLTLEP